IPSFEFRVPSSKLGRPLYAKSPLGTLRPMPVPIYVVDAFTEVPFAGNPAGVCLLEEPAENSWMASVAHEMGHAETAFLVPLKQGGHNLRWFTPTIEVDL